MNLLVLVVVGAFAWKLQQLFRQPRDRALQVVVASLGLIMVGDLATQVTGSLPVGVAKLVQNLGLVGSLYLLLCFFVYASREQSPGRGRVPRVRWELVPVAVVVVGMTVSWLLTPAPDRELSRSPGHITAQSATFYLLTYGYIGYNNLVCIYHALRISRRASRHPAIGLRVAALGLGVSFISAPIGGSAGIVAAVAGAALSAGLQAALRALLLTGIVVYLIGICWPGLVNRGRWIRRMAALWNKYRRLEPLRRLLRPALDLARNLPSGERRTRRWSYRWAEVWVECRDGLVTASAWVPAEESARTSLREQVAQLRAAVEACVGGRPAGTTRRLWALPAGEGFDADLDSLVVLADAVRGRSSKGSVP